MGALSTDLWQRLAAYEIGPSDASLSFARRLARENRWTEQFTTRVIREYKRFCYLAKTAGHEVTPSDAVDQAWHLHLTYSRDYWQRFCPEVLEAELHHGPTAGGTNERTRYYDQYAATLKSYEEAFGEAPPEDIWPDANRRFTVDPLSFRVNPRDAIVLDKVVAGWIGRGLLILLAIAAFLLVGGYLQ
jgi:hypothetical protein